MSTCIPDIYGAPCTTDQNIPWWTPAPVDTDTLANTGFEPAQALAAFGIVFLVAGVLAVILEVRRRTKLTSARTAAIAAAARKAKHAKREDPALLEVDHLPWVRHGIAADQLREWLDVYQEHQILIVFRPLVDPGAGYVIRRPGEPRLVVLNPAIRPAVEAGIAAGRMPNARIQEN